MIIYTFLKSLNTLFYFEIFNYFYPNLILYFATNSEFYFIEFFNFILKHYVLMFVILKIHKNQIIFFIYLITFKYINNSILLKNFWI